LGGKRQRVKSKIMWQTSKPRWIWTSYTRGYDQWFWLIGDLRINGNKITINSLSLKREEKNVEEVKMQKRTGAHNPAIENKSNLWMTFLDKGGLITRLV
jgi:hypothetical protein